MQLIKLLNIIKVIYIIDYITKFKFIIYRFTNIIEIIYLIFFINYYVRDF